MEIKFNSMDYGTAWGTVKITEKFLGVLSKNKDVKLEFCLGDMKLAVIFFK